MSLLAYAVAAIASIAVYAIVVVTLVRVFGRVLAARSKQVPLVHDVALGIYTTTEVLTPERAAELKRQVAFRDAMDRDQWSA